MGVDDLTKCPGCDRLTPTIAGRCPQCWYQKTPTAKARRRHHPSTFDLDEFDLWDPFMWSWIPVPFGLVLIVLGLVLDSLSLLAVGVTLGALRVGAAVLPWDSWW